MATQTEINEMIAYQYSTGGGAKKQGNCGPRAIAIASGNAYRPVLAELNKINRRRVVAKIAALNSCTMEDAEVALDRHCAVSPSQKRRTQCQHGTDSEVSETYFAKHGWGYVEVNCHMTDFTVEEIEEIKSWGTVIIQSKRWARRGWKGHMAAMVDGVIYDTWDSRTTVHGDDLYIERFIVKAD